MANIVTDEEIKDVLQDGLTQVDENLVIDEFDCVLDPKTRKMRIHLTAINSETAEEIELNEELG